MFLSHGPGRIPTCCSRLLSPDPRALHTIGGSARVTLEALGARRSYRSSRWFRWKFITSIIARRVTCFGSAGVQRYTRDERKRRTLRGRSRLPSAQRIRGDTHGPTHFIRAAAAGAAVISTGQLAGCGGGGDDAAGTGPDLLLVNGDIHTLDDQNSTISSIGIRDGRFVPEGDINRSRALVIDLRGRTVVPGLIESHTHFVSLANRPGYHVAEWELASNVAGVLEQAARASPARRARRPVHHGDGRRHTQHVRRAAPADAGRDRQRGVRPAGLPVPGRRRARARRTRSASSSSRARPARWPDR